MKINALIYCVFCKILCFLEKSCNPALLLPLKEVRNFMC